MRRQKLVKRPKWSRIQICVFGAVLAFSGTAITQTIDWHSIDGGGGISSADGIQVIGVVGQADSVRMTGANISLSGGYLPLPPDTDAVFMDGFEQ